jgi:hypothetical protein
VLLGTVHAKVDADSMITSVWINNLGIVFDRIVANRAFFGVFDVGSV